MKANVRVTAEAGGLFTVYLVDPSDPGQAVYHVSGVSPQLTDRDESELRWAASRCGIISERDMLRDTRAALRQARAEPTSSRARLRADTTPEAPPPTSSRRVPASGQPVAKALRRRKEKPNE